MTAATMSVYPPAIEALLPAARRIAEELGVVPPRNELMRRLKIGAVKATEVRAILANETADLAASPATVEPVVEVAEPAPVAPVSVEPEPQMLVSTPDPTPPVASTPVELPVQPAPVGHPGTKIAPERLTAPRGKAKKPPAHAVPAEVHKRRWIRRAVDAVTSAMPEKRVSRVRAWPVLVIALPAFVAIWSGWVGLGSMTGFGVIHPLPGIADDFSINSAITLPIGIEAYAAYALKAWLSGARVPARARAFAKWSGIGALVIGALGQICYHVFVARGLTVAPEEVTTAVSCMPVIVLGLATALAHLLHTDNDTQEATR